LLISGCTYDSQPKATQGEATFSAQTYQLATDWGQQAYTTLQGFHEAPSALADKLRRWNDERHINNSIQFGAVEGIVQIEEPHFPENTPTIASIKVVHKAVVAQAKPALVHPTPARPATPAVIDEVEAPAPVVDDFAWASEIHCPLDHAVETKALMGALSGAAVFCLQEQLDQEERMTMRDRISRVLIANAFGKGDRDQWAHRLASHLHTIDRSDPDMSYLYAVYLAKRGHGSAREVIRWSNNALENRHRWTANMHTKRVYDLHRMRTQAALGLWAASGEYRAALLTGAAAERDDRSRNLVKQFSREWYDYAVLSEQDPSNALAACKSAVGHEDFCTI